ncbi:MAG: efflux RND transporter permease subunit [Myxococcota bacterium]|nr:efflux RND transporter permease subunit [Myxococcota bacterium]
MSRLDESVPEAQSTRGPIAWMTKNSVAANLLMFSLLAGGFLMSTQIKKEVFPEFTADLVNIQVPYPGASPEEVEQGIALAVEEAVRGLDAVKKVTSRSLEGVASVNVELFGGSDGAKALSDVKAAVDRITSFPEDAERPTTSLFATRSRVISIYIHGQQEEETLRSYVEQVRDDLLKRPAITQIELGGVRPREIAIEISQQQLNAHRLTLSQVAEGIRRASIELPGGVLKTTSGETLLRTRERRTRGDEFAEVSIRSGLDGATLQVGEIAEVLDGFEDVDLSLSFNGEPAVRLDIYRIGEQTPIEIADAVKGYVQENPAPEGLSLSLWSDRSRLYQERADLLGRNAIFGLFLVLIALGLFLEIRLAFWVMLGIPISFLGAFVLLPSLDISINMISMFAFIVTLGIVVDDAIVVGENIYEKREQGMRPFAAALAGVREVGVPVVFAVLTTVAAFSPMLFVPGPSGKLFRNIPAVVIAVLIISLVESLFILPAHLAHSKSQRKDRPRGLLRRFQESVGRVLNIVIERFYQPILRFSVRHRYSALAFAFALLLWSVGVVKGGHLQFTFMPKVEGDVVRASVRLPLGSPVAETEAIRARLIESAQVVLQRHGGEEIYQGIVASLGQALERGGPPRPGASGGGGGHVLDIALQLVPSDQREVGAEQLAQEWGALNQEILGVKSIKFNATLRTGGGIPIDVALSHRDPEVLEEASLELAGLLRGYEGLKSIDDGYEGGKRQLDLTLKESAHQRGLSEALVARQLRDAFFGAEVLRQQRGRDEVRVRVRLPLSERRQLSSLESLLLRSPDGGEVPLSEVAMLRWGRAFSTIQREEGRRINHVTADVEAGRANANAVLSGLQKDELPDLLKRYPGLSFSFEGQRRDQQDSFKSLQVGFPMALGVIFALLAIPFRSYIQPLIIMMAIPFGFIGAVLGHLILGYDLSLISIMGIVALAGIVVNDSLILIVATNEYRTQGLSPLEAVVHGGMRRFRPILLTSLTTFMGLMPMIFEPSVQARFLIPMAISLGFGVLFATALILLVVPAIYLIVEDIREVPGRFLRLLGFGATTISSEGDLG